MLDMVLQAKRAAVVGMMTCAVLAADDTVAPQDHRVSRLETFFKSYNCPTPLHVEEYLSAADIYEIDYRLLPAISLLESTCGSYERRNNHWGWAGAQTGFSTVAAGIHYIASQLAENPYYKDKTLEEKLLMYNPDRHYLASVRRLMRQIEN
jgi:hypothetical protein